MKRIILLLTVLLIVCLKIVSAQKTVTGTVTSTEDGLGIPGVAIQVEGTSVGTITDFDGNYTIEVPEGGTKLFFSFLGMTPQTIEIGDQLVINVALVSDAVALADVVVTANAIVRERRELGYAVSTIKSDETTKAREGNFVNALSGKVAGVRISSQSGTLGGSSKILIRGANSLGGKNEPLFVVDGVPVSNSSYNRSSSDIIAGGVDAGNRANDLNADDIESITILKGAAATALYGARAKDGAIIITTKKGDTKSQKLNIDFNSSTRFDNVLKLPEFQNEYAQGRDGIYDVKEMNGWGPKISSVTGTVTDFRGEQVTLKANPNNVKDFYQTGITMINSLSFAGGSEKGDFRLGYTNLNQSGTIPESLLKRNNFSLNAGSNLSKNLTVRATVNYIRTQTEGKPAQGSNDPNVLISRINNLPRTLNIADVEQYVVDDRGRPIGLNGSTNTVNNPYWIIQNNKFTNTVERVFGSINIDYKPAEWITFSNRIGTDFFNDYRRHVTRKGTLGAVDGHFYTLDMLEREVNNDFMISILKKLSADIQLKAVVGHNVNQRDIRRVYTKATDLTIDELYTYGNASNVITSNFSSVRRIFGVFADVGISYKNWLFINATGRNDWSSTLPVANRSYFYPSVSSGIVFTNLLPENELLSYGKLRMNYANVGSDEAPYQLDFLYSPATEYNVQYNLNGTWPHGGEIAFNAPTTRPSADLRPQNQISYEAGLDLKFFNDRIGLDITYYNTKTDDQIVEIATPPSTGFYYKNTNAGVVTNKGIEFLLSGTPVQIESGFRWDIAINFAKNQNIVEELTEGIDEYTITSGWAGLYIKAAPGEALGLYGGAWKRDEAGNIVVNEETGLREVEDSKRLGNIFPDWTLGINNSFSYKNLSLSFLIDVRQGGVIFSGTTSQLRGLGLATETLAGREGKIIAEGVVIKKDGSVAPNQKEITVQEYWENYSHPDNTEGSVFDASFVKLREISLYYALPKSFVSKTSFTKFEIGIEARNLWIIKDHLPHVDPETNLFGASQLGEGVEYNSVPSTRSFGFNLRFSF